MTEPNCRKRSLVEMTVRELAHLRLLNERCLEIERWIHECVARTANASILVGAAAHLRYQFGAGNPGFDASIDVTLATLGASGRFDSPHGRCGRYAIAAPLSDVCASTLFVELHRRLDGDWSAMLAVGHLHADLSISLRSEFDKRN